MNEPQIPLSISSDDFARLQELATRMQAHAIARRLAEAERKAAAVAKRRAKNKAAKVARKRNRQ